MASLPEQIGQVVGGTAARGKWIARGAWLLALAEVAVLVKSHLDRLDAEERSRLVEIVRNSKGRPANLSRREKSELKRMLDKIEPNELVKGVAASAIGRRRSSSQ
jgi:23S rRNA pseudoU1915 N3-methylase RlmH